MEVEVPATFDPKSVANSIELSAFLEFRQRGKISLKYAVPLGLKALLTDIPFAILNSWPGPVGMKLRQIYYAFKFGKMGSNVIIGQRTDILFPQQITVADYAFIDKDVTLNALGGKISVGRRVHIAPQAIISGLGGVELGDYSAVGAFARVYSHTEAPIDGKRMSGPMIPEDMKGMITAPVRVAKDGLIATGAVVLPGVTIGEGAIVAANSLVPAFTKIPPWTIYAGVPAKLAGFRHRVTSPDI